MNRRIMNHPVGKFGKDPVRIVGKNDVVWQIEIKRGGGFFGSLVVNKVPGSFDRHVDFAAKASLAGQEASRKTDAQDLTTDFEKAWLENEFETVYLQALAMISVSKHPMRATYLAYLHSCNRVLLPDQSIQMTKGGPVVRDNTLAMGYNPFTKETILYINPLFVRRVMKGDMQESPPVAAFGGKTGTRDSKTVAPEILAYLLMHEVDHLAGGHLAQTTGGQYGSASDGGNLDNAYLDLIINTNASKNLFSGGEPIDGPAAVDGGIINPLIYVGTVSVKDTIQFAELTKLSLVDSEAFVNAVGPIESPVIVRLDSDKAGNIDPTSVIDWLIQSKPYMTVSVRADTLTGEDKKDPIIVTDDELIEAGKKPPPPPPPEGTPEPPPPGPITIQRTPLKKDQLVRRADTGELGVVTRIIKESDDPNEQEVEIKIVDEDWVRKNMNPEAQDPGTIPKDGEGASPTEPAADVPVSIEGPAKKKARRLAKKASARKKVASKRAAKKAVSGLATKKRVKKKASKKKKKKRSTEAVLDGANPREVFQEGQDQ